MSPPVILDEVSGLEKVKLSHEHGHSAEVFLHGGHIASWKSHQGVENLFLSSKAVFKPPKAIRGGIPVCFPQFGPLGPLDQHGFARNRSWKIDPLGEANEDLHSVSIVLTPTEEDRKIWPHNFELRQRITLSSAGDLVTDVSLVNVDSKPFSFTFALHTYFSVTDISEVRIEGLEACDYLDNLADRERFTDDGDSISFDSEFDRIYLNTPPRILIVDHGKHKTFAVCKKGLPDAVVWNPWKEKARGMSDFGDEEYRQMVCVEAAAVEKPIVLKPGEEWHAQQELKAVPSSFHSGQLDRTEPETPAASAVPP